MLGWPKLSIPRTIGIDFGWWNRWMEETKQEGSFFFQANHFIFIFIFQLVVVVWDIASVFKLLFCQKGLRAWECQVSCWQNCVNVKDCQPTEGEREWEREKCEGEYLVGIQSESCQCWFQCCSYCCWWWWRWWCTAVARNICERLDHSRKTAGVFLR